METDDPELKRFGLRNKSQKMKYDKFISLYMISFNAIEAYAAVSPKTTKPDSIKRGAYTVVRHPYVAYQLTKKTKELEENMDMKILMNRERILDELELILETAKNSDNLNAALKSLDQLARVTGAYAPEKSEIEHKGVTINYIKPKDDE